ncbi:MAG TPA: DUF503 domain-containing protein [Candidatus Atopostipes pullistercoris]|uniref:DUF503 domain-containing protein n=1 Tax=Candidatus Atopostipes pullistercoris TaxID=2838467 RepID=A0A9D2G006_9LACT|nr:DUF503 domain-containing protein [Candidatus Atopostipes pullistercoris]
MNLIGIEVYIRFHYVESLKDKRRIIKSILDKTRHKYQISTAEVGDLDSLDTSSLGFGMVTNDPKHAEVILQKVINFIDTQSEVEIFKIEWLKA